MFQSLPRTNGRARALLLACSAVGVIFLFSSDACAQTKTVATNLRGFGVPFTINANDPSYLEVQLYLSTDEGNSWQFYARESTDRGEFPFFAEADGEYWFALKTLDRDRRLVPDGKIVAPELKIVVDTVKPKLDFRIETDSAGRVACRWKATDPNIRPDTLKIEYQAATAIGPVSAGEASGWKPVDVQLADARIPATGIYADQVAWWPDPDVRQATVRLQISDSAGNTISQQRQVIVPLVAWRKRSTTTARPLPIDQSQTAQRLPEMARSTGAGQAVAATASWAAPEYAGVGGKPAGVICENGVCRLAKKPMNLPAAGGQRQSGRELYGLPIARNAPSPTAARRNMHAQTVARPAASEAVAGRGQVASHATRVAQGNPHRTIAPPLNLVGSVAEPVAPPVPAGYVAVAQALPSRDTVSVAAASSATAGVVWESETERWAPRNRSTFATTLKPDPALTPAGVSAVTSRRTARDQVPSNPAIQIQQGDQTITQSSTHFPSNQYQGVAPSSSAHTVAQAPPVLMPGVAQDSQASNGVDSLGPLQNFAVDGGTFATEPSFQKFQKSSFARPRTLPMPVPSRRPVRDAGQGGSRAALQMISTKRFRLDYAIDAIDPSGVAKVDLWMTRDNGRNWTLWGSDPNNRSPFPVQVNDEGRYGFRIVIHSRDGLTGQGPSRGDAPDMFVHVDSQAPLVKITSVPYGRGDEAGRLVINWSVSDPFITLRPITLSYSRNPMGPWTLIDRGLRNVGRYVWKVDANVPERLFLKIEAIDQAGNLGTHQLSQPIDVSGLVPRGTIRGVVPVK